MKNTVLRRERSALFLFLTGSFLSLQVGVSFAQSVSFSAATSSFLGLNTVSVAVGDFNGDGKPDLAVGDFEGFVGILLGNGAASLIEPEVAVGARMRQILWWWEILTATAS